VPLWGYEMDSDPTVMAKKIDAAADNGVDHFLFDCARNPSPLPDTPLQPPPPPPPSHNPFFLHEHIHRCSCHNHNSDVHASLILLFSVAHTVFIAWLIV
jgi:hypothetical protein